MALEWRAELDDELIAALGDVLTRCFEFPREAFDEIAVPRIERRTLQGVLAEGELVAGCGYYDCGQYWGGERLRFAGVALVGVLPAARRQGIARFMMSSQLRSLAEAGVPLAGLYPSTQRLYRSVGFEQAGVRMPWELPLHGLVGMPCPARPTLVEESAVERLSPLAEARARRHDGNLERSEGLWSRLLDPMRLGGSKSHVYVFESGDRDEGYVIFSQRREPGQIRYDLHLHDWVAETLSARQSLLAFLSDHRSMARKAIWHGAAHDGLLALTPEQDATPGEPMRWMLRLVDAKACFEGRGYGPGRSGRVAFEVQDELLPGNAGRFVLEVEGGRGTWRAGGDGALRCEARGLAAIFSGALPARELASCGLVAGPEAELLRLEALFAGPTPWLAEMF